MSFIEAVKAVLGKYATFTGRARRAEYWWFVLFNVLVSIAASILDMAIGLPVLATVVALGLLLPGLAVTVRRLHDTDRSGWWILIGLVPLVGFIVMLVFTVSEGTPGPNRFGPSPKHGGGQALDPQAGYAQPGYTPGATPQA